MESHFFEIKYGFIWLFELEIGSVLSANPEEDRGNWTEALFLIKWKSFNTSHLNNHKQNRHTIQPNAFLIFLSNVFATYWNQIDALFHLKGRGGAYDQGGVGEEVPQGAVG